MSLGGPSGTGRRRPIVVQHDSGLWASRVRPGHSRLFADPGTPTATCLASGRMAARDGARVLADPHPVLADYHLVASPLTRGAGRPASSCAEHTHVTAGPQHLSVGGLPPRRGFPAATGPWPRGASAALCALRGPGCAGFRGSVLQSARSPTPHRERDGLWRGVLRHTQRLRPDARPQRNFCSVSGVGNPSTAAR